MSLSACLRFLLCGTLLGTLACGGDSGGGFAPLGGGDGDGDGSGDGGVVGMNPSLDQGGPNIMVVSPTEALDPVKQDVVVGASWKVQCKVTQKNGGGTIDTGTIQAVIYQPGVADPVASVAALSEGNGDLYSAMVPLSAVPHGKIYAGCVAADVNTDSNLQVLDTFYDKGPSLEIKTPSVDQFLKKTIIPIVVKVGVARLSKSDTEAGVTQIKALINGDLVRLDAVADAPLY
jgi:hypothetical protein